MKTKLGVALCIVWGMNGMAFANGVVPITNVVLYPGSAAVERVAHVTPGMSQLEIKGIPANFDTETIRVQAEPGIHVGQVVTQDIAGIEAAMTRETEIQTKILALQDKQASLEVDAKSATVVEHYLEHLSGADVTVTDKTQAYVDAKSMAAVIDTIRRNATDSFDRLQKFEVQKREIGESIKVLQNELEQVRSGAKYTRNITINMNVQQPGAVHVSYQINGAGWKPTYRAALDSAASNVELERLATVSQKTGEDWNGVTLKLSTGQPRLSPLAPEPNAWLLTYYHPSEDLRARSSAVFAAAAPAPIVPVMKSRREKESNDYEPPIIQVDNAFATEFEVPARVTLAADGREISVALSKQSLPVKQSVRVVPRTDKSAVVTAEAERPSGVWLNGNIQLFRDGNYVGATEWNAQASEHLSFSFGRDDLVQVKIDHGKQQSGTTGILSQHAERHVADQYTITSLHKKPIAVLVLESSPVSTSDEIKVQASFQPKPAIQDWEQRQGVVGWEKTLAPNESMKISMDYDVTYPKEGNTMGLP